MNRVLFGLLLIIFIFLFFNGNSYGEAWGDINNDGIVGLDEAIYALQVASGIRDSLQSPSYIFRGSWIVGKTYKENDLVVFEDILFLCIASHDSITDKSPPLKDYWKIFANSF